ncbi:BMP family protein [Irregularibacter muris]|uniref:BMP family protein n=1 Tax=Irregularibacter muris TaxID=1796619 RepID=A0AAE3HIZ7_9FIRM|nr:BMP family protein [Irregularibacter muris]MCR1899558.1 BMP family protein [Irregularibacter muris]
MKFSKKIIVIAVVCMLVIATFAGCSGKPATNDSEPSGDKKVKVGLIALEFGTQSFNDDILKGLKSAEEDLEVEAMSLEVPEVSDVANSLRTLIGQGAEFLVVSTSEFKDGMLEVAQEFPDVKFLYLSEVLEGYDNVMSIAYKEHEAAFLAGALGGLMTETNTIGAVLALEEDIQYRYQNGYKAGAMAVNPDAKVLTAFTNSYSDIGKGNEVANVMYSKGADFVGTYAGACNLGVFKAAEDAGEGKYAFGAANGQFDQSPEKIVASVVKPIDQAIHGIIEEYLAGKFDTSAPKALGLKESGVTLLYTPNEELLKTIPEDVKAIMDDLTEKVISEEIKVPSSEQELKDFNYKYEK